MYSMCHKIIHIKTSTQVSIFFLIYKCIGLKCFNCFNFPNYQVLIRSYCDKNALYSKQFDSWHWNEELSVNAYICCVKCEK